MDNSDDSDAALCIRRVGTSAIADGAVHFLFAQCLVF